MTTEKKEQAVKDFQSWLEGSTIVISTNYTGIAVGEMTELRRSLREKAVIYKVVKNTLAHIAADNAGETLLKEIIQGPSAVAFGYGEPTEPAKALSEFIKKNSALSITGAVMDGQVLSAAQVEQLAELPSREQLLSNLLGQMQAPIAGLANVLNGPIIGLARVLQGQIDKSSE